VRRQVVAVVAEAAQVDDAPNASPRSRRAESAGGLAVHVLERTGTGHRVHEVEGDINSRHRPTERFFVETITGHQFSARPHARLQPFGTARHAPDAVAARLELRKQEAAGVTRGPRQQYAQGPHDLLAKPGSPLLVTSTAAASASLWPIRHLVIAR
jgi:hypothetical protein